MSEHTASIRWQRGDADFLRGKFSRVHTWTFDGGTTIEASAAPSVVPAAYNSPTAIDPEEAFVASLSSCHMLTFLYFAYKRGFQVDGYEDHAVGLLAKGAGGVPWISTVTLRPRIAYGGDKRPTADDEQQLHHDAHENCFIANSVKTDVRVESLE